MSYHREYSHALGGMRSHVGRWTGRKGPGGYWRNPTTGNGRQMELDNIVGVAGTIFWGPEVWLGLTLYVT